MNRIHPTRVLSLLLLGAAVVGLTLPAPALADGGVVFTDIANGDQNGIDYRRERSHRYAVKRALETGPSPTPPQFFSSFRPNSPQKPTGAPGVALFDYDNDGDVDIYVTNGPGAPNSLYHNQLVETGSVTFVDVAQAAGVGSAAQDSSGVCYGDIDNDGDQDLYVVATAMANAMFENNGDGTFTDITNSAGVAGDGRHAIGCSFADFDQDGLLDVTVGNTYDDWNHRQTVFVVGPTYPGMEHNYLFLNQGGNTFTDVSSTSGIENVSNMSGPGLSGAGFTWAIGSADIDLDGDVDIFNADNQGGPSMGVPEHERGWMRIYENDGAANFTDVTQELGTNVEGGWMGVTFADFNCDQRVDYFVSNLGYLGAGLDSRWFLQNADGTFADPGPGSLLRTPFGWGTSSFDYDNDGDWDIVYGGGIDLLNIQLGDNPNPVLQNQGDCSADFAWDQAAITQEHRIRSVNGLATADLDNNGFPDIVSVSNFNINPFNLFGGPGTLLPPIGSPFDPQVVIELSWVTSLNPGFLTFIGDIFNVFPNQGTLSVELNDGANGNNWVRLGTTGGAGLVSGAGNNRDGIGAVLFFTPDGGNTSLKPIDGGASYGSHDGVVKNFGLGSATSGTAEVLWPGGVRNKVYDVAAGETLELVEIPCSYDADWKNFGQYNSCVMQALNGYKNAGVIDAAMKNRLRDSARRAYDEAN